MAAISGATLMRPSTSILEGTIDEIEQPFPNDFEKVYFWDLGDEGEVTIYRKDDDFFYFFLKEGRGKKGEIDTKGQDPNAFFQELKTRVPYYHEGKDKMRFIQDEAEILSPLGSSFGSLVNSPGELIEESEEPAEEVTFPSVVDERRTISNLFGSVTFVCNSHSKGYCRTGTGSQFGHATLFIETVEKKERERDYRHVVRRAHLIQGERNWAEVEISKVHRPREGAQRSETFIRPMALVLEMLAHIKQQKRDYELRYTNGNPELKFAWTQVDVDSHMYNCLAWTMETAKIAHVEIPLVGDLYIPKRNIGPIEVVCKRALKTKSNFERIPAARGVVNEKKETKLRKIGESIERKDFQRTLTFRFWKNTLNLPVKLDNWAAPTIEEPDPFMYATGRIPIDPTTDRIAYVMDRFSFFMFCGLTWPAHFVEIGGRRLTVQIQSKLLRASIKKERFEKSVIAHYKRGVEKYVK